MTETKLLSFKIMTLIDSASFENHTYLPKNEDFALTSAIVEIMELISKTTAHRG